MTTKIMVKTGRCNPNFDITYGTWW